MGTVKQVRDEIAVIVGFDAVLAEVVLERVDRLVAVAAEQGVVDGLEHALLVLQRSFNQQVERHELEGGQCDASGSGGVLPGRSGHPSLLIIDGEMVGSISSVTISSLQAAK